MVARQMGRNGIGLELSDYYLDLSRERLQLKALENWERGIDGSGEDLTELPLFQN